MKKAFFFFIVILFITRSQAQNNPRLNSNVALIGKNNVTLIQFPSVTIVNEPGSPVYNKTWMKKNLSVKKYRNGDPIPEEKDSVKWGNLTTGAWCYFNNDFNNGKIYGILYNWYAINDPRGLAPAGWHIPSDTEWTILSNALGGDDIAGGKMKTMGSIYWPNQDASNYSGFTGLPGGGRDFVGHFGGDGNGLGWNMIGLAGIWWSSTQRSATYAWPRKLMFYMSNLIRKDMPKQFGLSVRCIKD